MAKHGANPWQARTPSRDWQAAKRAYRAQPPRPRRPRRGLLSTPLPLLAALLLLGGLFWAMLEEVTPPPLASVPSGPADFGLCSGSSQSNCVIDGDTLRVGGETIRLADVHAPEIFDPECPLEEKLGRRAARRLSDLVSGRPFTMKKIGTRDVDHYGRSLRVLTRDGRSLGDTLVFEGLASKQDRSWCPA